MSAAEPLCRLIGIEISKLSREEFLILEAELFHCVCIELKEIFRAHHKEYFRLMKFTREMENDMLEQNFLRFVINDILAMNEYTIQGFAHYVDVHEDVVHEVILGRNLNPSAQLLQRAIGLHKSLRSDLYQAIVRKILVKFGVAA